ncbi:hypothetical protein [uncultured Mediterranean phage uvMED]|nr:hypothetical protein [uncultured Mediterranean phage uvMED]|tara:strand:- start:1000 stop:1137 length:138 start_codon:yes stop_codon:yes gene_type:complete
MEQANLTYSERLILVDLIDKRLEDNDLEDEMIVKYQKIKNKLEFK